MVILAARGEARCPVPFAPVCTLTRRRRPVIRMLADARASARDAWDGARVRARVALGVKLAPGGRRTPLTPPPLAEDDEPRVVGPVAEISYEDDVRARGVAGERALSSALAGLREPLVVRGGAEAWMRAKDWTLEGLVAAHGEWACDARVVSEDVDEGRMFVYCEESHRAVRDGTFTAPSTTVRMPFSTAVARVLRSSGRGGAYVQSDVAPDMARACEAGGASASFSALGVESQGRRLWLALAGSVSPLHFDASWSTLTQVGEGRKRMLLHQPFALGQIGLYPNWHPLRRRGRHFAKNACAWEAIIEPGDVLVFPPRWAHYTESLGDRVSIAVTQRFTRPREKNLETVAGKFQHWMEKSDRPNALARLLSLGLVDEGVGAVLPRDARTGEVERGELSGWMSAENDEWRAAAFEGANVVRQHITDDDLIGIYCRGSVARGEARSMISDVDLIVVTRDADVPEDVIRENLARRLALRFSHMVKKFDVRFEFADSAESVVSSGAHSVDVFVLSTQCVTICGCPLPDLLPSSARVPKPRSLTSVRGDVADALRHGSERAIMWALKRLIRAAYERYALPRDEVGFTRDLYHSVRLAALHANVDISSDLATALVVCVHSPKLTYGDLLWRAQSAALCRRLLVLLQ